MTWFAWYVLLSAIIMAALLFSSQPERPEDELPTPLVVLASVMGFMILPFLIFDYLLYLFQIGVADGD